MSNNENLITNKELVSIKSVQKWFGDNEVLKNITFDIYKGEFLSFLGPSGCGKTTCLRILAGFEEPDKGEVWIDGENMIGIPPNKRDLSMVFQDYSLFPHMSVFENVAFGLKERKEKKIVIQEKVKDALELIQLPGFEERNPNELSGGQKQRVAIARSLVLNPKLLLLDEPLGALDLKLRKQMQTELKALQNKLQLTFVYVTHDQEEALTMSGRIIVLDQGMIRQIGSPFEIYNRPRNRFVADFIGETTFLKGKVERIISSKAIVNMNGLKTTIKAENLTPNQKVILSLRPQNVKIKNEACSLENKFKGVITKHLYKGATVDYYIKLENDQEIVAVAQAKKNLIPPGEFIQIGWDENDLVVISE